MNKSGRKPVIGIIGGIASGKTSVAAEFEKLGCFRIDADKIVHNLLDTEDIKNKVVYSFEEDILDKAGGIDRKKLADIVFNNPDKLLRLNRIIHPPVLKRIERLIARSNRAKRIKAIVLDMPLLLKVGWRKRCDYVIFVECDLERRLKRAKKLGIYNENQLRKREKLQIPLDRKAEIADTIVRNNSGYSELARQVARIFLSIVNDE